MALLASTRLRASADFDGDLKKTFLIAIKKQGLVFKAMSEPYYWPAETNERHKDYIKPYRYTQSLYSQVRVSDSLADVQTLLEAFQKIPYANDNIFGLLISVCKGKMTLDQLKKYPAAQDNQR